MFKTFKYWALLCSVLLFGVMLINSTSSYLAEKKIMDAVYAKRDFAFSLERQYHLRNDCFQMDCRKTAVFLGRNRGGALTKEKRTIITIYNPGFTRESSVSEYNLIFGKSNRIRQLKEYGVEQLIYSNGSESWTYIIK